MNIDLICQRKTFVVFSPSLFAFFIDEKTFATCFHRFFSNFNELPALLAKSARRPAQRREREKEAKV